MRKLLFAAALLLAGALPQLAHGQLFMRSRAPQGTPPPRALIVLLPTGQNRIAALKGWGDTLRAGELRRDLEGVREKMVQDFRENFTYCPYYFAPDTSIERLRSHEYSGVLLDSLLRPVATPVVSAEDTTLLVAYYGYRERDPGESRNTITGSYQAQFNGDTEAMLQQLVLSDYRLQQLVRPFPRTVGGPVPRSRIRRPRYEYRYQSKHYDIQYRASASAAALRLENFYGPYPY